MRLIFSGNVAAAFRVDENIDSIILTLISLTMNPAVVLSHITVNTIKLTRYWISEVLAGYPHRGSSHTDNLQYRDLTHLFGQLTLRCHHGGFVVEFEHNIVDVDFIKGKIFDKISQ